MIKSKYIYSICIFFSIISIFTIELECKQKKNSEHMLIRNKELLLNKRIDNAMKCIYDSLYGNLSVDNIGLYIENRIYCSELMLADFCHIFKNEKKTMANYELISKELKNNCENLYPLMRIFKSNYFNNYYILKIRLSIILDNMYFFTLLPKEKSLHGTLGTYTITFDSTSKIINVEKGSVNY